MKTTRIQQLRQQIEEKNKAKKTMNDLELFDYVEAKIRKVNMLTKSGCVKLIRKEGYAISQSRVFSIFDAIQQAIKLDERDALVFKLDKSSKTKLTEISKTKAEAEAKMAALMAEIQKAEKAEAAVLGVA
jgi:hypothetical protein